MKLIPFLFAFCLLSVAVHAHGVHEDTPPAAKWINASTLNSKITISEQNGYRLIKANGIPNHVTGKFPGSGNPHAISEQSYAFQTPLSPSKSSRTAVSNQSAFGVALNGVPFDPGTAEYWKRDRNSGWVEEGIVKGKRLLGIDQSNGHVQPNGAYHYHGIPVNTPRLLSARGLTHIGYAADGFRIFVDPTYQYRSSYRLKKGARPDNGPAGYYDGTYTQDFEYSLGHGDLDQCNGMVVEGEYIYVLTREFPYIPRCWVGTPHASFRKQGGGGGRGLNQGRRRPPPGHRPPPRDF